MTKPVRQPITIDPRTNHLLAKLNREDYLAVMLDAKIVSWKFSSRLFRQEETIKAVYFPVTAMVSLLVTTNGRTDVEMATTGREGVVGAQEAIQELGAMGMSLIQLPGAAVRIEAAAFRNLVGSRPLMEKLIHQHMYALTRQILQGAACNRLHTMEERCSRWLLMTHDRAGHDTFPLTQEFLSHMLGVRRATVNVATGMLKKAGYIRYVRGMITIVDRPRLELASCECYRAILRAYDLLLQGNPISN